MKQKNFLGKLIALDMYNCGTEEIATPAVAEELLRKKILEAVRVYLLPTGWLSRSLKGGRRHVCADCDNSL